MATEWAKMVEGAIPAGDAHHCFGDVSRPMLTSSSFSCAGVGPLADSAIAAVTSTG